MVFEETFGSDQPLVPRGTGQSRGAAMGIALLGTVQDLGYRTMLGTAADGVRQGDVFCDDWTADMSDSSVAVGSAGSPVSPEWTSCAVLSCGALARLYCFEQALE